MEGSRSSASPRAWVPVICLDSAIACKDRGPISVSGHPWPREAGILTTEMTVESRSRSLER